jgi:hypothetical protein
MSESEQPIRSRTWWRRSGAIIAIAIGAGIVGAVAAMPGSQAESHSGLGRSPAHEPVIARSICDTDIVRRSVTQTLLRNRGDRPGVAVTFSVEQAKPGSRWSYEVSVTSTTGSQGTEVVSTDTIRANRNGQWSITVVNRREGRYYAESGIAPLSGAQYCAMGVTAAP